MAHFALRTLASPRAALRAALVFLDNENWARNSKLSKTRDEKRKIMFWDPSRYAMSPREHPSRIAMGIMSHRDMCHPLVTRGERPGHVAACQATWQPTRKHFDAHLHSLSKILLSLYLGSRTIHRFACNRPENITS